VLALRSRFSHSTEISGATSAAPRDDRAFFDENSPDVLFDSTTRACACLDAGGDRVRRIHALCHFAGVKSNRHLSHEK
jgi:hypothetical protein